MSFIVKYTDVFRTLSKSSPSEVFLGKGFLNICSKLTGEDPAPKCVLNKVAKQLCWNHTSASVFSCKFAACFQNTFSWEYLLSAASVCQISVIRFFCENISWIKVMDYFAKVCHHNRLTFSKYASELHKKTRFYLIRIFLSWWNIVFRISCVEFFFLITWCVSAKLLY